MKTKKVLLTLGIVCAIATAICITNVTTKPVVTTYAKEVVEKEVKDEIENYLITYNITDNLSDEQIAELTYENWKKYMETYTN